MPTSGYCALTGTNSSMQMAITSNGTAQVGNAAGSGNYNNSWHKFVVTYSATKSLGTYFIDDINTGLTRAVSSSAWNLEQTLFSDTTNSYVCAAGTKIKYAKWYDANGTLVKNLIPVKNSNNVLGMYDIEDDYFYPNAGSGNFIAGPAVNEEVCGKKNQLVKNGNFITNTLWQVTQMSFVNTNNIGVFTSSTGGGSAIYPILSSGDHYLINGHVYYISYDYTSTEKFYMQNLGTSSTTSMNSATVFTTYSNIFTGSTQVGKGSIYIYNYDGLTDGQWVLNIKNFNLIDLTEMFGAGKEPTTVSDAESKIAEVFGYTADYYPYDPGTDYCTGNITQVKVATTKYVETKFALAVNELNTTMGTIKNVVDNTIIQADRISKLHTGKQNRPAENCPDGAQCLLITEADGSLHWYPICNADGTVGTQSSN